MTNAVNNTNMFQATVDTHQLQHWMAQTATRDRDQALPRSRDQAVFLYGYTAASQEELRTRAQACASPIQASIMPPDTIMTKPMPDDWREGERFGFNMRIRPIIRSWRSEEVQDPELPDQVHLVRWQYATDAYTQDARKRASHNLPPRARDTVYAEWLAELLKRQGGARLAPGSGVKLQSFRRSPSDHKRNSNGALGPEAIVQGTLVVADPEAFKRLISEGTGRHKAYGYGMVLLRAVVG